MWDLKLILVDLFLSVLVHIEFVFLFVLNFLFNELYSGYSLWALKIIYLFPQNLVFVFSLKFFFCIAFLILIRGGTPRYRYDYLTKLGWLKFLSLVVLVFSSSLLFFYFI